MLELRGLHRLQVGPIELRVDAGACVAIQGRSGAGKSVLLRMVADLDVHQGDALLDGEVCSAMPAPAWRRRVTYVAPDAGWWQERVGEHFPSEEHLRALLPAVGIDPAAGAWAVARLSTGERQRIALLRALQPENRVLLLDEPTSGLDPDNIVRVEALLRQRLDAGTSILLVTHDPEQARRLASRRFALRNGQLHEEATA